MEEMELLFDPKDLTGVVEFGAGHNDNTRSDYEHIDIEAPDPSEMEEVHALHEQPAVRGKKVYTTASKKTHMNQKTKNTIFNVLIYTILVLMSVVWLLPFVFIVLESFRVETTTQVGYIWPEKWGFGNYISLFRDTDFGRWFLNTTILGIVVAVLQTAIVLCVSFALSRTRFAGRKLFMNMCLILGMFPGFLTLILLYKLLFGWGMTGSNSIMGLIVVYVASSGMGYYITKGYFDTIPRSLDEAARVDGATRATVFFRIILPMAKPIVIYAVLMGFMAPWGDFVLASYIAHVTSKGYNVAVGLNNFIATSKSMDDNYTKFCAGGVCVAIPITALFLFLQKYYVAGVTGGAVKG